MQPFNKYYPKDFDPSKSNSVNQHLGKHPLGVRARKLKSEGILIIRFELPFSIWCSGCENHIGMGVRYNAEKKKVGSYLSTPIWSFRMKCHLCENWIEIQTDPKNTQYVVAAGARKRHEDYAPEDAQVLALSDDAHREKLATNPLFKLQNVEADKARAKTANEELRELKSHRDALWEDSYGVNKLLRQQFRIDKKARKASEVECKSLQERVGTEILMLPESEEDRIGAALAVAEAAEARADDSAARRKSSILAQSIFHPRSSRKGARTQLSTGSAARKPRLLKLARQDVFGVSSFSSS